MYSQSAIINAHNLTKRFVKAALGRDHLLFADISLPKLRLGTRYGGWFIAPTAMPKDRPPIVVSFGIGDDISFDLEMIDRYDAQVYAFDPTPKSMAWLARQKDVPASFQAFPVGVANYDGTQSFGLPPVEEWDNYSVRRKSAESVDCPVKRISTIVDELAIHQIDVMKMDIEGSEYDVLPDFFGGSVRPAQMLVEFHHGGDGIAVSETTGAVRQLREMGYRIFDVSPWGREFSMIHRTALPG